MKALVISNCATAAYVDVLKALFPDWDARGANLDVAKKWLTDDPKPAFQDFFDASDVLVTIEPGLRPAPKDATTIVVPGFYFRGLHPDCFHLAGGPLSVLKGGTLYSRIATVAFMLGKTEEETSRLFDPGVYEAIGYLKAYDSERRWSIERFTRSGIEIDDLFDDWQARGNFLYTYNHPKIFVFVDILRRALVGRLIAKEDAATAERLRGITDRLALSIVWPVYPEIGVRHGIAEPLVWRTGHTAGFEQMPLDVFIARTFQHLRQHPRLSPELVPGYAAAASAIQ